MTELTDFTCMQGIVYEEPKIDCPTHGIHHFTIASTIPGHEGRWCMICWLETLGKPLPVINK